jgi:acyl-CoA synthetase (AMP-forming)/AMP-acid ligase II
MAGDTGLTMMYCPATLVNMMTYLLNSRSVKPRLTLAWLVIGAEPISREVVRQFYTYFDGKIVNTYGPTECTINNTYCDLAPDDRAPVVPIGRPVANNHIYILDRDSRLVPLKIPGEICIAGDSVARGYINKPDKTHMAFARDPFGDGHLFKTGDIGRWLEDGNIEIMGRMDEQVKVRGYRIEPGEIETALSTHPSVNDCIVLVKDSKKAEQKIKRCKSCGITTRYPGLAIEDQGVCSTCETHRQYRRAIDDYFKTPARFRQELAAANQHKQSQYDCLLLYAGGRGAAYALYQLVDMGFNVLALTYDNGYFGKRHLENIKKITDSLGVDHVVLTHPLSDRILGESIKIAAAVCRGCFHTSSYLAGEYAYRRGINVVVGATLSRGQIIENKLLMFLQQGISDEKELEAEIAKLQQSAPEIDKTIFDYIGIDKSTHAAFHEKVKFKDFYRYWDITNRDMIAFLDDRAPYWKTRKNYAVYSTNCPIKQLGDFGHLQKRGFHYYGAATAWEVRLGHLTLENLEEDLTCNAAEKGYEAFLKRLGCDLPKEPRKEDKYLCAYFLAEKELPVPELREYLSTRLPEFMIPSYFVPLEKFPLLANGKIDRKSLPEPERSRSQLKATYVAPNSDMEIIIANIWKEVLNIDMAGIHDNFFDLGGTSIDIIKVGSRLKEVINRDIPAVTLFTYPKIESLAGHLTKNTPGKDASKLKEQQADKLNKAHEKTKRTVTRIKRRGKAHLHV